MHVNMKCGYEDGSNVGRRKCKSICRNYFYLGVDCWQNQKKILLKELLKAMYIFFLFLLISMEATTLSSSD